MPKDAPGPDALADPRLAAGGPAGPDLAEEAAAIAVALAKAHLRALAEAREITLNVMRRLDRRTEIDVESVEAERTRCQSNERWADPPPRPPSVHDPASVLDKMSRALRRTIALEMKVAEHLRALAAGLPAERESRRAAAEDRAAQAAKHAEAAAEARRKAAKDKVRDLVEEAILSEDSDGEDSFELSDALNERLDEDDAYMDLETRPLRQVVEEICKDLKVAADWSRWENDRWKPRPFPARPKWSEFNTPSRKPLMAPPPPPQVAIDEINAEIARARQKAAEERASRTVTPEAGPTPARPPPGP